MFNFTVMSSLERLFAVDVNECESDPCQNGGHCSDHLNAFSCACVSNYHGLLCESYDPCINNTCVYGSCARQTSGYSCDCSAGYYGSKCEMYDHCRYGCTCSGATCSCSNNCGFRLDLSSTSYMYGFVIIHHDVYGVGFVCPYLPYGSNSENFCRATCRMFGYRCVACLI